MLVRSCLLLLAAGALTWARAELLVTSQPVYVRFERQQQQQPVRAEMQRQADESSTNQVASKSNEPNRGQMEGVQLGNDFLGLFDEIWRIKRLSLIAIAENQNALERQPHVATTSSPATSTAAASNTDQADEPSWRPQDNPLSTTVSMGFGLNQMRPFKLLQKQQASPQVNVKQQVSGNSLFGQLSAWLQQVNSKIGKAIQLALARPSSQPKQLAVTNVVDQELGPDDTDSLKDRKRRQVEQSREADAADCVQLNQEQMNECRFAEFQVGTVLNSTFPATLAAIEDNCRHVTFLLSNCWPDQLQLIRLAILSGGWNETMLHTSSFQLPPLELRNGEPLATTSCGLRPQLSPSVLDRLSWMWLNFCMDKKFLRDYLDHLRCLSFWNQDRAHAVCHDQWRLFQNVPNMSQGLKPRGNNVDKHRKLLTFPQPDQAGDMTMTPNDYTLALLANATTTPAATAAATTTTTAATTATAAAVATATNLGPSNRQLAQEARTGDLESKTICCVFDLFLRCVHRQALRDCGRSGAQLVVNFMARVGNDDMKWVCNSGNFSIGSAPKTRPPQQPSGKRGSQNSSVSASPGSAEQSLSPSPFIERSYCNDPKIGQALRVQSTHSSSDDSSKFPGNDHHHQRHRPGQGGRTNTRGPMQSNGNPLQDLDDAEMALKNSASSPCHRLFPLLPLLVISIAHFQFH